MVRANRTKGMFLVGTLLLGFLTLIASCGESPPESGKAPAQTGKLTLAYDTWTGTYLPIYVLKTIFEDKLGYTVKIVELSVPDAYEQVARGGVHIYTDGWFPSQDSTYYKYPNLVKLGQCYGGKAKDAYEGWLVPTNFAREYGITNVRDLGKGEVARALDADGDGKGNLIGAPKTWLASKRNDEILANYGLVRLYEQDHGTERELMEAIGQRLSQGKPTLFYLVLPNAFPTKVPVSTNLTWLKGSEQSLPLSFVRAVVRSDFIVYHPEAAKILSRYRIPGADISWSMEQIAQEGRGGESPRFLRQLAQTWIDRNRQEVNKWLEGITAG